MAKAITLSDDILIEAVAQPRAAQMARPVQAEALTPPIAAKVAMVPLQIRIEAADAKAIKRAALEADQTISDFMLACFHAFMKQ